MNKKRKILLAVLIGTLAVFFAVNGVACFKGSFELTDFIVNTSGVVTTYEINDEVNLDGLTMTAIYSDDSQESVKLEDVKIFLNDVDITNDLSKITESVGVKTIKIVYATEYGEKSKELTITVTEETIVLPSLESFEAPIFISNFNSSVENATDDSTAESFESNYFVSADSIYVVGADNAFKFVPEAMDAEWNDLSNVLVDSTVKMNVDGEYVELTKSGSDYVYEYAYENKVMVVEYANKNEFDFTADAVGNVFNISVLPDASEYENVEDFDAIEFEIKIVEGYNVCTADELCLMDNTGRVEWQSIKASLGLTDVQTNGIVLHQDIAVTKSNLPDAFMYTLPDSYSIKYKLGDTVGAPEDFGLNRTFLWDTYNTSSGNDYNGGQIDLYVRKISAGQSFNFYGNFFALDLTDLPLVASFDAGTASNKEYVTKSSSWYGSDFSNATFLHIIGDDSTKDSADETCEFKNVTIRGNADTDSLVITSGTTGYKGNESLVYCGGIIFTKYRSLSANVENVRTYKFFITFFGDPNSKMAFNKTKVYDSASNAMYIWENSNVTVNQSFWQRAGGPLILIQHNDYDKNGGTPTMATVNISEDSVMEAYVEGSEAWFQSVNAGAIVTQFKALDQGILWPMQKAMFNENNKMNLIALVMSDGQNPTEAMTALDVQGYVSYGDTVLDRVKSETPSIGMLVHGVLQNTRGAAPVFNFGNNVYYYGGETYGIMDANPNATPGLNNGAPAMYLDAQTSDKFAMNYGGFGLMFGLFDRVTVG